jgi:hypothetical protein
LENILRDNDYTTIGIYTSNGWTYCTQTFGLKGSGKGAESGAKCTPVGGGGGSSPDKPTNAPTTKAVTEAKTKPVTEGKTKPTTYAQMDAKPTDAATTPAPTEKPTAAPYSAPSTEAPQSTEAPKPTYDSKPTEAPKPTHTAKPSHGRKKNNYAAAPRHHVKGSYGTPAVGTPGHGELALACRRVGATMEIIIILNISQFFKLEVAL